MVQNSVGLNHAQVSSNCEDITTAIEGVDCAHFRLLWVVGLCSSNRTQILKELSSVAGSAHINVGAELSAKLMEVDPRLRPHSVEEIFFDLLNSSAAKVLCLDRLEILFDPGLRLNPIDLLRNASRKFLMTASWPGTFSNQTLVYGCNEHPSHFQIPVTEIESPIHLLTAS